MDIAISKRNALLIFGGLVVVALLFFKTSFFESLAGAPPTLRLEVPFSPQAPTGLWEGNENCEETSLIMAKAYLDGNREKTLPALQTQQKIDELNAWEDANFGHHKDSGANETMIIAEKVFGLSVRQIQNYRESDIKNALAQGRVVLLPTTRDSQYHMIVVIGYDEKGFIVHDPGSDGGANNVRTFADLKAKAIDWNSVNHTIDYTRKIALVVSK